MRSQALQQRIRQDYTPEHFFHIRHVEEMCKVEVDRTAAAEALSLRNVVTTLFLPLMGSRHTCRTGERLHPSKKRSMSVMRLHKRSPRERTISAEDQTLRSTVYLRSHRLRTIEEMRGDIFATIPGPNWHDSARCSVVVLQGRSKEASNDL